MAQRKSDFLNGYLHAALDEAAALANIMRPEGPASKYFMPEALREAKRDCDRFEAAFPALFMIDRWRWGDAFYEFRNAPYHNPSHARIHPRLEVENRPWNSYWADEVIQTRESGKKVEAFIRKEFTPVTVTASGGKLAFKPKGR
jgi:hypothetical protein